MYQFDLSTMWDVFVVCVQKIPVTFMIAFASLVLGLFFGVFLTMMRQSKHVVLSFLARAYILVMRCVPNLVMIIVVYHLMAAACNGLANLYGWENFNSSVVPKTIYAVVALTPGATAFMGETIRSALLSVPPGQTEAGYSIGMTKLRTLRRIVLPQAMPVALPMLGSHLINFIKATALVNAIGVVDVLNAAIIEVNASYKYLEAYVVTGIIYWMLTIVIEQAVKYLTRYTVKQVGLEANV